MRKLVKKLALVLALVLALGCIAPASAQAAEVRRSWNFAPDAYKPTYSMTVGDDYSFELYDQGDAIDPSIYDVAYYSKSDALAMSKSTGYAVAVAAAEGVKICAVVTNKVTGNTAKVWGLVDIAAKVVETTPEVTPTVEVTPEATPTEAPFALVDAYQTSKNSMKLVFNKDAADVTKADLSIKYALTENSTARYNCYIKKLSASDNTVSLTFYSTLKDESIAFVSYKGGSEIAFPISVGEVTDIKISTTLVAPQISTANVKVKLIDDNGVLIEEVAADKIMADGDYFELVLEGTEDENGNEVAYATFGGVYFYEAGNSVLAKVYYHTGTYNEDDGMEIILEDETEITCIDQTPIIEGSVWSVTKEAVDKSDKANYSSRVLSLGDTGYRLAGKLSVSIPQLDGTLKSDTKYSQHNYAVVYESSDTTKLLVDKKGGLVPVSTGDVDVIVRLTPTTDPLTGITTQGDIIGVATVTVREARKLNRIAIDYSKVITVATRPAAEDKVTINATGYDQFGDKFALTTDGLKLTQITALNGDLVSNIAAEGIENATLVSKSVDKGVVSVTIKGADVKPGSYRFRVKSGDKESAVFAVTFRMDNETPATYKFAANTTSVNVKTQGEYSLYEKAPIVKLDVWAYDATQVRMYKMNSLQETIVDKTAKEGITDGSLWYDVTVPADVDKATFIKTVASGGALVVSGGSIFFDPLKNRADDTGNGTWRPDAWKAGTYTFTLYAYNNGYRVVNTIAINVTNDQESLGASLDNVTSTAKYATVMTGSSVGADGSGYFTATAASCGALFSAVLKDADKNDSVYCINVTDGTQKEKTLWLKRGGYEFTQIEGYANGLDMIVVTKITLTKTYTAEKKNDAGVVIETQLTNKVLTVSVPSGSITFAK